MPPAAAEELKAAVAKLEASVSHSLLKGNFTTMPGSPEDVYAIGENVTSTQQSELGLTVNKVTGGFVEGKYVQPQIIDGVIDYTKLDENSYKAFGFNEVKTTAGESHKLKSTEDKSERNEETGYMMHTLEELSQAELKDMSPEQRAALRMFTSNEYEWINASLYAKKDFRLSESDPEHQPYFVGAKLEPNAHYGSTSHTPEMLREVVTHMDAALENAPRVQRLVYRGMSPGNAAFKQTSTPAPYDKTNVEHWMDENIVLGKEMVFDGYQSSSMDGHVAMDYSGSGGVVYEILTSEGANVVSVSEYDHENEVILPRNSRYMVVGVHRGVDIGWTKGSNLVQLVAITETGAVSSPDVRPVSPPELETRQLGGQHFAANATVAAAERQANLIAQAKIDDAAELEADEVIKSTNAKAAKINGGFSF
jgi:hypothetical protein